MNWLGFAGVYFVSWFISLLATLPFGVQRTENPEPGHDAGAPVRSLMWRKAGAATVLAAVVTGVVWLIGVMGWVNFRPL